jgi:hypothetical protein
MLRVAVVDHHPAVRGAGILAVLAGRAPRNPVGASSLAHVA